MNKTNFLFRSILNNTETSIEQEEVKAADHFLLHVNDESWTNTKNESSNENKKTPKIPTPPPSSFVPINLTPTIAPPPPPSSSPAYSDISDEDPSTAIANVTQDSEKTPTPSTINLLTATNGEIDENDQSIISKTPWAAQMLLQQYGSYIQQQTSNW